MLRGFREVERNIEKEDLRKKESEAFKKIKPESDITVEEARAFWQQMFLKERD